MSLLKAMLLTKATDRHHFNFICFKLKSLLKRQNTVFYYYFIDLINVNMHKYLKE